MRSHGDCGGAVIDVVVEGEDAQDNVAAPALVGAGSQHIKCVEVHLLLDFPARGPPLEHHLTLCVY